MVDDGLLVLGAGDVRRALDGREAEIVEAVAAAYRAHGAGQTVVPHSSFLRFAADDPNRIIALPAYLGDDAPLAGLKWIASFPGNVERGIDRASALLILNSVDTGRPVAVVESSIVSGRRTAASAALAARELHGAEATRLGVVGCGFINFEIMRFARAVLPELESLVLFDLLPERADQFGGRVIDELGPMEVEGVHSIDEVFAATELVSFATVASTPHVERADGWSPEHTVLHISLRDLAPSVIRAADNVVDDVDHVLRAQTSLHLTELEDGRRDFIRCPLADVLSGQQPPRAGDRPVVFSPFGLGMLDLAVARMVLDSARAHGGGIRVPDFLPPSWSRS